MQIDNAAGILAGTDFFAICTDEERRLLAFASERKRYPAGAIITQPGDVPIGAQVLVTGASASGHRPNRSNLSPFPRPFRPKQSSPS